MIPKAGRNWSIFSSFRPFFIMVNIFSRNDSIQMKDFSLLMTIPILAGIPALLINGAGLTPLIDADGKPIITK